MTTSELLEHCVRVLSQCDEFENDDRLRDCCIIPELVPHRDQIPNARSPSDRLMVTLGYFIRQAPEPGYPLLVSFLHVLQIRRHPDNPVFVELGALRTALNGVAEQARIKIPLVIMAMTQEEAAALLSGQVFDDPDVPQRERERFGIFQQVLERDHMPNLQPSYATERDDWTPHGMTNVHHIVDEVINSINNRGLHAPTKARKLEAEFLSNSFFAESDLISEPPRRRLREQGGILIIDTVSLFHPILYRQLLDSQVFGNEKGLAVYMISPISSALIHIHSYLEQEIARRLRVVFDRFDRRSDRLCDFGLSDTRMLRRWINAVLPDTEHFFDNESLPSGETIQNLSRRIDHTPGIYQTLIFPRANT